MRSVSNVDQYFEQNEHWASELQTLRSIIVNFDLEESLKWSMPVYSLGGKNVVSIAAFKKHINLYFFQGVYLADPNQLLENAQEGKTKAMRHIKIKSIEDLKVPILRTYISEAIANENLGLRLKPEKLKKAMLESAFLMLALSKDKVLSEAFNALSVSKQNEYHEYIALAKRISTKESRFEKVQALIMQGKGLNDQYKKA